MKKLACLLLLGCLVVAVAACGGDSDDDADDDAASGKLRVVATTTQIGDFAGQLGGDRIELTILLKPNQDAHDYTLEPSQVRSISRADLVLRNGLGLDEFLDKALKNTKAKVVDLSEKVKQLPSAEEDSEIDPHIWFDPTNAQTMVKDIRDALVEADAPNASFYAANFSAYFDKLIQLDRDISQMIATVPTSCRKLVTNHDALNYYTERYGFRLDASVIPSTSTSARASASDVARVVDLVRSTNVPAVFAEASINDDLMEQVAREAKVKLVTDLYTDSLGPGDSDGATYVEMMLSDTRKIVEGLSACKG